MVPERASGAVLEPGSENWSGLALGAGSEARGSGVPEQVLQRFRKPERIGFRSEVLECSKEVPEQVLRKFPSKRFRSGFRSRFRISNTSALFAASESSARKRV